MHIDYRLPLNVELGATWRASMNLDIVATDGGFEHINRRWAHFLREFDITYPITQRDSSLLADVTNAFLATGGGEHSFDFRDWRDHQAVEAVIGTGDGVQTVFPLIKSYSAGPLSYLRRIYRPKSPITVRKDGIAVVSGMTVDYELGIVTFTAAPAEDVVVDWSGEFNVPVRFDRELQSQAVTTKLEHLQTLTLYEKRLRPEDFL